MVKDDAYGHGLEQCLKVLNGADALGLESLSEALRLRKLGYQGRIVLMAGFINTEELLLIQQHQIEPVIHHASQVELLLQATLSRPLNIWLKVNTGMNRLGLPAEQFPVISRQLQASSSVGNIVLMSHLCCADESDPEKNRKQIERFQTLADSWPGECSLANSAAILNYPQSTYQWVRAGAMLYGFSPFAGKTSSELGLKAAMVFRSKVIAVNKLRAGESVGYGGQWVAGKDTCVAVVACGYGNGYPRHAANGTPVLINGRRYPLVGRVSMDMLSVELGDRSRASIGDDVELWGRSLPVEEVASHAGTIAYECLLHISSRVPFVYT